MAAPTAYLAAVDTYLCGRRTYETMAVWGTDPTWAEHSPGDAGFAATWQAADKQVGARDLRLRSERRFGNGVVQATFDVVRHR